MWYEIMPSVAVVLTLIGAPAFINYATGYLITRNGKVSGFEKKAIHLMITIRFH
jgi:hypothetical protein